MADKGLCTQSWVDANYRGCTSDGCTSKVYGCNSSAFVAQWDDGNGAGLAYDLAQRTAYQTYLATRTPLDWLRDSLFRIQPVCHAALACPEMVRGWIEAARPPRLVFELCRLLLECVL